ncbi:hypothetical protein Anas_07508 [Armadillidium nasatum]|uniref:Gamma-interferon-inducible lysosomal thiol reductase n=1 Tax=Armadillidium nasatum TaxID=96803 RepID=A0A5N5TDD2_9CRUS|nr:hypothetical protein Anas_07508 [Armadillidium nasatum]
MFFSACILSLVFIGNVKFSVQEMKNFLDRIKNAYKVKVEVHIESFCPDSRTFVSQKLKEAYDLLEDIMDVEIGVYGFASYIYIKEKFLPFAFCSLKTHFKEEDLEKVVGENRLYEAGQKQRRLIPQPSRLPWIIINDVYKKELNSAAEKDLISVVCNSYKYRGPSVGACSNLERKLET